jgi:hypothetical protein
MTLAVGCIAAGSALSLAAVASVLGTRQWVRLFGRRGIATIISVRQTALLPRVVHEVVLQVVPDGEPEWVQIRTRMRWSDAIRPADELVIGSQLPVRYRLGSPRIVMPDARLRRR